MPAVLAAVLIGIFVGLAVRPLLDAYLRFKTARFYEGYLPSIDDIDGSQGHRSDVS